MPNASTVAKYLINLANDDAGEPLSHLKLQKLLYYSQGFHLAMFNESLFPEKVSRWQHGPVVEPVYHEYKSVGSNPLPVTLGHDFSSISKEQTEMLDEVYNIYGQFSAWKLRDMTHSEPPWMKAADGEEISIDSMKEFFKTLLIN